MKRVWAAMVVAVSIGIAVACGGSGTTVSQPSNPSPNGGDNGGGNPGGNPVPDAGRVVDAGTPPDAGMDAGVPEDAGTDAGEPDAGPVATPGPWPLDEVKNYSAAYNIPWVQSVGVDDGYNIWLLQGDRIGVLRPGTLSPVWVSGIGQAAQGFSRDALAEGSTVICGGTAGRAYVGYWTYDLTQTERTDPNDPEFQKGDLDVVQLTPDGKIQLEEHLWRSAGASQPWPPVHIGIHNSNDWHYDEDRSVLACQKVMRGPYKGEVYISGNHGVTRIRGLEYDAHRHVVWDVNGSLMIGYDYGLGIGQNGDVLIANEWKVGIATPPPALVDWEYFDKTPWQLDTFNDKLNSLQEMDYWRAFQETTDGSYYLGSDRYGLWKMTRTQWVGTANWEKVAGVPSDKINALAATDDGSLYIGTGGSGLWVLNAQKELSQVSGVAGGNVQQLVYDPTVTPSMLYVLTDQALTVIRGK